MSWLRKQVPDGPIHNFSASWSGDRRVLCSSGTSCDGFWSSKIVEGFVGYSNFPTKHLVNWEHQSPNLEKNPSNLGMGGFQGFEIVKKPVGYIYSSVDLTIVWICVVKSFRHGYDIKTLETALSSQTKKFDRNPRPYISQFQFRQFTKF